MDLYDILFWAVVAILIVVIVKNSRKTYGTSEGMAMDKLQRVRVAMKAQHDEEILAKATAGRKGGPVGCTSCRRGM